MFFDMTKEEKENFKQAIYEQLNYGTLLRMEKALTKINFFFWGLVSLTAVLTIISIIWLFSFGFVTLVFSFVFLIWTLMSIRPHVKISKALKKGLDEFMMNLSNNKLNYREYKIYKNML